MDVFMRSTTRPAALDLDSYGKPADPFAEIKLTPGDITAPVAVKEYISKQMYAHGYGSKLNSLLSTSNVVDFERQRTNSENQIAQARHDLLEILEERYGRRSTIITSQLPVEDWHAVIGDPTYADAILDRLVHNAHRLNLSGDSLRRSRSKPAERG